MKTIKCLFENQELKIYDGDNTCKIIAVTLNVSAKKRSPIVHRFSSMITRRNSNNNGKLNYGVVNGQNSRLELRTKPT